MTYLPSGAKRIASYDMLPCSNVHTETLLSIGRRVCDVCAHAFGDRKHVRYVECVCAGSHNVMPRDRAGLLHLLACLCAFIIAGALDVEGNVRPARERVNMWCMT